MRGQVTTLRPNSETLSADTMTRAAAPSAMTQELPTLTEPRGLLMNRLCTVYCVRGPVTYSEAQP